jgi:PAS domain S-box-containing protein
MVFDSKGLPVYFIYVKTNKNFETLTGLRDVDGKKVTELIPGIATTNPELFEIYGRVSLNGKPERFETYLKQFSKWFLISVYCPAKGYFFAAFEDTSNRKQIEQNLSDAKSAAQNVYEDLNFEKSRYERLAWELEKFKLACDNAADNVIITDPDAIVLYVNKSVETTTGYTAEEVIGKKSGALWQAPMKPEFYRNMWHTLKTEKKRFTGEIQNRRRNGEIYTAELSIAPVLDARGDVEFFVGIERDITKEKEIDLAKTEFVSLASHQLRTPPSIIGWYTETLQSGDLGPVTVKQSEYLAEIYRANQRMITLINSLLNISRIEMGNFSMSAKKIDFKELIGESIKELESRFDRVATVTQTYDPALEGLTADQDIMGLIIDNLLSNALKYSPHENTKIEISATKDQDMLVLSIKDNGIGIPEKAKDQVFEKLFRADNAVTSSPAGTGLGLYMTKKVVVNGLGGKIWFDSKENEGSTFYVSIPIVNLQEKIGTTKLIRALQIEDIPHKLNATPPKDGSAPYPQPR